MDNVASIWDHVGSLCTFFVLVEPFFFVDEYFSQVIQAFKFEDEFLEGEGIDRYDYDLGRSIKKIGE